MKHHTPLTLIATLGLATAASAEITGAYTVDYTITAEDFGGTLVSVNVQDLYLSSDDGADVALNIYNLNLASTAQVSYFQSATGTGWLPSNLGGIFDTPSLRKADSFVTIGGFAQDTLSPEQVPGTGSGTGLDPDFGGNDVAMPAENGGWFNSSPPSLNGLVGNVAGLDSTAAPDSFGLGVLVGRFTYDGNFDLQGSTLYVTWNQGLGTPGEQASFTVVPAPGAMALLGLAGLAGRRRRD